MSPSCNCYECEDGCDLAAAPGRDICAECSDGDHVQDR